MYQLTVNSFVEQSICFTLYLAENSYKFLIVFPAFCTNITSHCLCNLHLLFIILRLEDTFLLQNMGDLEDSHEN